jgi:hypothetical protein
LKDLSVEYKDEREEKKRKTMNPNWNPNYDQVAKAFVPQYYAIMDGDKTSRIGLANFYSVSRSY